MEMRDFREKIDKIDGELVHLMGERMKLAKEIGHFKEEHNFQIHQPEREMDLIDEKIQLANDFRLNQNFVKDVFESIVKESKRIQGLEKK